VKEKDVFANSLVSIIIQDGGKRDRSDGSYHTLLLKFKILKNKNKNQNKEKMKQNKIKPSLMFTTLTY